MFRSMVVVIAFSCVTLVVRAGEKADQALKELQGDWSVEKFVVAGEALESDKVKKLMFTFKGSELIPSDMPKDVATITLDPSKKPATIDLTDRAKDITLGIYELSGDTLKMCMAGPGESRPKEFVSPKNSKTFYIELKRVKK